MTFEKGQALPERISEIVVTGVMIYVAYNIFVALVPGWAVLITIGLIVMSILYFIQNR